MPRPVRARAGRTPAERTPLSVRTFGVGVDEATRAHVRQSLGAKLGRFAPRIERLTVRFTDVNGPRGGVDVACDVKVVLSGRPSVVYQMRGQEPREAIDRAVPGLVRAVQSALERAPRAASSAPARRPKRAPRAAKRSAAAPAAPARLGHPSPEGSFIGRRVGRSKENLERALERPEKARRDVPVDTAAPGRSATDRKAGGGSTARRNTLRRAPKASAALEDSARDRPSRKSTRKSANRAKQGSKLQRRKVQQTTTPSARAAKATAR
ncbi:HPF/RaiA family ribosome-associated protein [Sorangium sp. So ce1153]|uniref:HPF/RaiA family ribosome-associated protein n=1 Tax=Sorangium sp. So ce1153 TaxID=3133333 RepID=UPI003F606D9D